MSSALLVTIFSAVLVASGGAQASPLFSIGDGGAQTWTDAISQGRVEVAPDPLGTLTAQDFYASQIGQTMDTVPVASVQNAQNIQLTPDVAVSDGTLQFDALVMSWGNSNADDPAILNVAAWDYVYGVDPDLTATFITFSLLPPLGVWDVSLELIDIFGNSIGWFGVPPTTTWGTFTISPTVFAAQAPFTAFFINGPFDIMQVDRIRLNESSQGGVAFIDNPALLGASVTPWNAWNSLAVRGNIDIDIKPGSDPNCFNSDGNGVIPVAILTTGAFDATTVDPATLDLDSQAVRAKNKIMCHIEDVDGDADLDLVCQIEDDGVYNPGAGTGTLTGQTFGGQAVLGTDSICIT